MTRLLFFPPVYPDEDFRSIIYRYHIRTDNKNIRNTAKELFGTPIKNFGHIPKKMNYLINRLPYSHGYSVEELLDEHTFIPFMKGFVSQDEFEMGCKYIYGENINRVYKTYFGVMSDSLLSKNIRYCPYCLKEDEEKYGECYIHLSHQLACMKYCKIHKIHLIEKCPKCEVYFNNAKNFCITPFCRNQHNLTSFIKRVNEGYHFELKLHNDISCVIKYNNELSPSFIKYKLMAALFNKGYINLSGLIKKRKLINEALARFSENELFTFGINKDLMLNTSMVKNFLGEEQIRKYPLYYILIIQYIFGSIKGMIDYNKPYSINIPFGTGPWICLNNVCKGYEKNVITDRKINKMPHGITGTFTCDRCGFTYSMTFRGIEVEPRKKNQVEVLDQGWLWKQTVLKLFIKGIALGVISSIMSSSYNIIKKFLIKEFNRLGINYNDEIFKVNRELSRDIITCLNKVDYSNLLYKQNYINGKNLLSTKYRERILKILEKNPNIKRNEIKKMEENALIWLRQNDKDWLDNTVPVIKTIKYDKNYLSELDEKLYKQIEEITIDDLYQASHNKRISKGVILNQINNSNKRIISRYGDGMPKTEKVINEKTEDNQDFLLRNLPRMIAKLEAKGYKNITINSLKSISKQYSKCAGRTVKIIEQELVKYYEKK